MKTKISLLIFFVMFINITGLFSDTSNNYIYIPLYFIPQTSRPNDPQIAALGLTGAAYRTGIFSTLTNPAGLAYLSSLEFCFSHIPSQKEIFWDSYNLNDIYKQNAFAIGLPISKAAAISLHYFNLNLGEVNYYDKIGKIAGKK